MKKLSQISFYILLSVGLISFASSSMAAVGGLTYGYVNWPSNPSYYNMDQLIRIDTAPQKNLNQGYFWSYQFSAGKMTGYFGLQQQPDGSRNINAAIWDTGNGVAGTGFTAASFGGEGTGIRIFGPYAWVPGKIYRLRIWQLTQDWWGFFIQDTSTGIDTFVGQIQNQFDPGKLLDGSVTFTEQFTGPNSCSSVAAVRSTWFSPSANGGTVTATKVDGVVSDSAAITSCGKQIVSVTNQINNSDVNQQIVCGSGAKSGLLGVASCWRFGNSNQSCNDVCTSNGIDSVFWPKGQNLSLSQCSSVKAALGISGNVVNSTWGKNGAGCMLYGNGGNQQLYNITSPPWSASYKNSIVKRFCGCAG